jgi:hypothetical protein
MGQCKYCDKKGFFLSVDPNGLCANCAPSIINNIQRCVQIIQESVDLAKKGKTFKTRISRCDVAIEKSKSLLDYEASGIPTMTPLPSKHIKVMKKYRDEIVIEEANNLADKAISKFEVATSQRSRESSLSTGMLKVKEINANLSDQAKGEEIENKLKNMIHKVKLDGFLEAAKKAGFKGQNEKAIDQYLEALYFIKHDEIPDELQKEEIEKIKAKIQELSG